MDVVGHRTCLLKMTTTPSCVTRGNHFPKSSHFLFKSILDLESFVLVPKVLIVLNQ
jgi:hypothetical protein